MGITLAHQTLDQLTPRLRVALLSNISDHGRLVFLMPEEVPDFVASLASPPAPSETTVRGYRVKVSKTAISSEDAQARRERLTKLVARSLRGT